MRKWIWKSNGNVQISWGIYIFSFSMASLVQFRHRSARKEDTKGTCYFAFFFAGIPITTSVTFSSPASLSPPLPVCEALAFRAFPRLPFHLLSIWRSCQRSDVASCNWNEEGMHRPWAGRISVTRRDVFLSRNENPGNRRLNCFKASSQKCHSHSFLGNFRKPSHFPQSPRAIYFLFRWRIFRQKSKRFEDDCRAITDFHTQGRLPPWFRVMEETFSFETNYQRRLLILDSEVWCQPVLVMDERLTDRKDSGLGIGRKQ